MSISPESIQRNWEIIEKLHDLNRVPRSPDLRVDIGALHVTNPELPDASIGYQTNTLVSIIRRSNAALGIQSQTDFDNSATSEYANWLHFLNTYQIDRHDNSRVAELHVSGLPLDQPITRNTIRGSLDHLAGWIAGYQLLSAKLWYQPLAVLRARTATIAERHLQKWGFTTFPSGYPNEKITHRWDLLPALARDPGLATDSLRKQELQTLLDKPVVVGLITPSEYLKRHNTAYNPDDLTMRVGSTTLAINADSWANQATLMVSHIDAEEFPGQDDVLREALIRIGARFALIGKDTVVATAKTHPLAKVAQNIPNSHIHDHNIYVPTMAFAHAIGTNISPNPPLSDYAIATQLLQFT